MSRHGLRRWARKVEKRSPLVFKDWDKPYNDEAGKGVVALVNQWFEQGKAAGLSQDTFRSFDSNHSKVGAVYPQLTFAKPLPNYAELRPMIMADRVTFGVQSLGFHQSVFDEPMAIKEFHDRCQILSAVAPDFLESKIGMTRAGVDTRFYRALAESNCLFVSPTVWNYKIREDGSHYDNVSFLSPFSLYSVGKSGSDSHLLKPFLYAAAALKPEVKLRMLRTGTYVPSLLTLFRERLGGGDLLQAKAHPSSVGLPKEAGFLKELVNAAQALDTIPPVTQLALVGEPKLKTADREKAAVYFRHEGPVVRVSLLPGQAVEFVVDASASWVDSGQELKGTKAKVLREPGGAETLQQQLDALLVKYTERHPLVEQARARMTKAKTKQSEVVAVPGKAHHWRVKVAWQAQSSGTGLKRTDIAVLASDDAHDGAAAYITVRHLQPGERWLPVSLASRE